MGLEQDTWRVTYGNLGLDAERRSLPSPVECDDEFMMAVNGAMAAIRRTRVGATLVTAIRPCAVLTHVSNFDNDFPTHSDLDTAIDHPAFAVPAAGDAPASVAGAPMRPSEGSSPDQAPAYGTGAGAWSIIYVNPAMCREEWVQIDGILVHELTHAMRQTNGAINYQVARPIPRSPAAYGNSEERLAMMLMNMYLSETRRGGYLLGYGADMVDGRLWEAPRRGQGSGLYRERARYVLRSIEEFAYRSLRMKHVFERLGRLDYEGYNPFRSWLRGTNPAVIVPRSWPRVGHR